MAKLFDGLRLAAGAASVGAFILLAISAGCGEEPNQSYRDRYGWNWDAAAEYKKAQAQQTSYRRTASTQPARSDDSRVLILAGESPTVRQTAPVEKPAADTPQQTANPSRPEPKIPDVLQPAQPEAVPPRPVVARVEAQPSPAPAAVSVQTRPVETAPASQPVEAATPAMENNIEPVKPSEPSKQIQAVDQPQPPKQAQPVNPPARTVKDDKAEKLAKIESTLAGEVNRAMKMLEKAATGGEFDDADDVLRDCLALLDKNKDLFTTQKYLIRRTQLQEILAESENLRQSRMKPPTPALPATVPANSPAPTVQESAKVAAQDPVEFTPEPPAQEIPQAQTDVRNRPEAQNPPSAGQTDIAQDEWQVRPRPAAPQSRPVEKSRAIIVDLPDDLGAAEPEKKPAGQMKGLDGGKETPKPSDSTNTAGWELPVSPGTANATASPATMPAIEKSAASADDEYILAPAAR